MQAIWKGAISFGMVTIPIKVYSATEEKDVSFRQVHAEDGGRIRYRRICELDGEEVAYSDIAKGYQMPDGEMVVLTADDFADLPLPSKKSVEVLEFVPAEQVDEIFLSKAYYLAADGVGAKPYVLLRESLEDTGQCALVKVAIRNREALALLRPKDGALVLHTMLWPDEVRDAGFAVPGEDVEVRPQEIAMAKSYIDTLTADFEPGRYHDEYREALERLVEAKSTGHELAVAEDEPPRGAEVVDLVAALQASVDAAKARRAEPAEAVPKSRSVGGPAPAGKTTKQAAKKPPAKKAASKSSRKTAKRAAAKKSA